METRKLLAIRIIDIMHKGWFLNITFLKNMCAYTYRSTYKQIYILIVFSHLMIDLKNFQDLQQSLTSSIFQFTFSPHCSHSEFPGAGGNAETPKP